MSKRFIRSINYMRGLVAARGHWYSCRLCSPSQSLSQSGTSGRAGNPVPVFRPGFLFSCLPSACSSASR